MNISKFKLIDGGSVGIAVTAVESISQGNLTMLDSVTRVRRYPLPDDLRTKIEKLKYFFLNLTGHWIEPYNKCFDSQEYDFIKIAEGTEPPKSFMLLQTIMNHTQITGVILKSAGFCITGTIETVDGKKMGVSTPFVTEEDDVSFFIEAMDKINVIMDDIAGLLKSPVALPFSAQKVLAGSGMKNEDINGLTSEEMVDLVYEKFEKMGAIVMINNDAPAIEDGKSKDKLHTSTKSIDSQNVADAIEHTEEKVEEKSENDKIRERIEASESNEEPLIIKDKAPVSKGSLASEKNFPNMAGDKPKAQASSTDKNVPEGGSLEDYEYSNNMGIVPEQGAGLEEEDNNPDESIQNQTTEW